MQSLCDLDILADSPLLTVSLQLHHGKSLESTSACMTHTPFMCMSVLLCYHCVAYRQLPLPPGPWVVPYIGDTFRFMSQGLIKISTDRMAIYGPIHRTWLLGERNVFVADAACVRKVLNGEHTIAEGMNAVYMSITNVTAGVADSQASYINASMYCTYPASSLQFASSAAGVQLISHRRW